MIIIRTVFLQSRHRSAQKKHQVRRSIPSAGATQPCMQCTHPCMFVAQCIQMKFTMWYIPLEICELIELHTAHTHTHRICCCSSLFNQSFNVCAPMFYHFNSQFNYLNNSIKFHINKIWPPKNQPNQVKYQVPNATQPISWHITRIRIVHKYG